MLCNLTAIILEITKFIRIHLITKIKQVQLYNLTQELQLFYLFLQKLLTRQING